MADMTVNQDAAGTWLSGSFAHANSAPQDTAVPLDIPIASLTSGRSATHRVTAYNPGAVDITVRFLVAESIGGSVRYVEIDNLTVTAAADIGTKIVTGLVRGRAARVTVENDTAVGGSGAFTSSVVCRSL